MTINVSNQKPAVLDPVYSIPVSGQFDPIPAIRKQLVDPFFEAINPAHPVQIDFTDKQGQVHQFDADDVTNMILATLGDAVNPDAEDQMKQLLYQGLVHYDPTTTLLVNETFAVQAGAQNKLPSPTPTCVYTPQTDVIPAARKMLAGTATDGSEFFASVAFYAHPETLGFYFANNVAFTEFKNWLAQQTAIVAPNLPGDTVNLLSQFQQVDLKALTESFLLRADDGDAMQDYSFARVIVFYLMEYAGVVGADQFGVMPFTLSELFVPRSIVLVNVEAHARALPNKVVKEWQLINQSITSPVKVVSNKQLSKLTALQRATAKAARAAATSTSNKFAPAGRSAKVKFRKNPPKGVDVTRMILRVIARMGKVNKSMNVFTSVKSTFLKPNRRDPDDWNKAGKIISKHYLPDIHIYLDTSGSISERHYQGTVMMLIRMAKKMNVNLYFNSFSHIMSQETLLHTKDKSVKQIWEEFRRIPKVTGGTDFAQIWAYIEASPKRRKQFSLLITDFEWYCPPQRLAHPKNLYYAPVAEMHWPYLVDAAKRFAETAKHVEPKIHQRLLGVMK